MVANDNRISDAEINLPDGIYNALRSGYDIQILHSDGDVFVMNTTIGVRGINVKTVVEVKNKILYMAPKISAV